MTSDPGPAPASPYLSSRRGAVLVALLAVTLAAVLPATAETDAWEQIDELEVTHLHVMADEPPSFHAVHDGAMVRLEEPGGEWRVIPTPAFQGDPQSGVTYQASDGRVTGVWPSVRHPGYVYVAKEFEVEIHRDGELVSDERVGYVYRSGTHGEFWENPAGSGRVAALAPVPAVPSSFYVSLVDPGRHPGPPELLNLNRGPRRTIAVLDDPVPVPVPGSGALAVDSRLPGQLYLTGRDGVYVSDFYGEEDSWTKTDLPSEPTALAAHPVIQGMAVVGTESGGLWRTEDYGASWQPLVGPPVGPVTEIDFDPLLPERFYTVADGRVYATADGGDTWEVLDEGLPAGAEVRELVVDPADPLRLFVTVAGAGIWLLDRVLEPYTCQPDRYTLCLGEDGRFETRAYWWDPYLSTARATARPLDREDSGAFWFFREGNLELLVKALDGRPVNGYRWIFYGSLTDVAFVMQVVDTETGEAIGYRNPQGWLASRGDTTAFPEHGYGTIPRRGAVPKPEENFVEPAPCVPDEYTLCLQDGRFQVEAYWEAPRHAEQAHAVPATDDAGFFWFFREGNLEMAVKVLDGRVLNRRWWNFYASVTDVAFDLIVTDTTNGQQFIYRNPAGTLASRGDVDAFKEYPPED